MVEVRRGGAIKTMKEKVGIYGAIAMLREEVGRGGVLTTAGWRAVTILASC